MALSKAERQRIIAELTTNCDCWSSSGDDEVLNRFTDDKLVALKDQYDAIQVANTAVSGFADPGSGLAFRYNPTSGKWEKKVLDPDLATNKTMKGKNAPTEDDEEDEEDDEEMMAENKKRMKMPANNSSSSGAKKSRPMTREEWLRSAPEDVQNSVRYAEELEAREKAGLIRELLVNVSKGEQQAQFERLQRRSIDDLRNDLALMPKQVTVEETQKITPRRHQVVNKEPDDMLGLPTMNWSEVSKEGNKGKGTGTTATASEQVTNEYEEGLSQDEWLQSAPANVRATYLNAVAVETREKEKLIDELTANVSSEEAQNRLINRLRNKSLDELRELMALSPKKEQPRPSYFGAATPANNSRAVNDHLEDVLPLPVMNWKEAK